MLIIAINAQILLQGAVDTFYLAVGRWVVTRSEVKTHAEE